MAKITSLAELTEVADDDLLVVVDKSDTSMADSGTDKKVQRVNLLKDCATLTGTQTLTNKTIDGDDNTLQDINPSSIKGGLDGWIPVGETWTYASATTFTISGDKTGKYQKGDKIKLTQTSVKYFYVVGVSYSSPNTTVTVTGGSDYSLANATITSPFYSKAESPQGFPYYFNYTCTPTPSSGSFTTASAIGKFHINNGLCTIFCEISLNNVGSGTGHLNITLPVSTLVLSCGCGRERAITGKISQWYTTGGTTMMIINYDNSSVLLSGSYIVGSCSYLV